MGLYNYKKEVILCAIYLYNSHMVLYKVKRNFDKRQKKFLHHPKNPKQHNQTVYIPIYIYIKEGS